MTDYDEEYDDVEVETEEEEWADEPDPEGMSGNANLADIFFLAAFVVAIVAAIVAWIVLPRSIVLTLISVAIALVALAWLVL